jgi:hypothetical protein
VHVARRSSARCTSSTALGRKYERLRKGPKPPLPFVDALSTRRLEEAEAARRAIGDRPWCGAKGGHDLIRCNVPNILRVPPALRPPFPVGVATRSLARAPSGSV